MARINKACLFQAQEAAAGTMTDEEVMAHFNRAAEIKQAGIDAGRESDLNEHVMNSIDREKQTQLRKALDSKRRVQLAFITNQTNLNDVRARAAELGASNKELSSEKVGSIYRNAVLSIFHGSITGIENGRVSIERQKWALESKFRGALLGPITKDRPHILKMLKDPAFDEAVTRELFELKDNGSPGVTNNSDAKYLADLVKKIDTLSRIEVNKHGAGVTDRVGYAGPEAHNDIKIIKNENAWKADLSSMLDLEASFPGLSSITHQKQIMDTLGESYYEIIQGKNRAFRSESGKSEPPISSQFVFKNADSAIEYQKKWGYTSTIASFLNTISARAHDAAIMEKFTTHPRNGVSNLLAAMRKEIEDAGGDKAATNSLHMSNFETAISIATGQVNHVNNMTAAKVMSSIRSISMMAHLGGSLISSIPADTVTKATASMFRGDGFVKGFMGAIFKHMDGLPSEERQHAAAMYAEGFDGILGSITRGALAEDGRVSQISKWTDIYFKLNGLTPWTDSRRAMEARMLGSYLGKNSDKQFENLNPRLQNVLNQNGIDRVDWEHLRSLTQTLDNGNKYMFPEGFNKLTDLDKPGQDKLELKLRGFIADEVSMGMLEPGAKEQYSLPGASTHPGTIAGEAMRVMRQFSSFPMAFTQNVLGRSLVGTPGKTNAERILSNTPHIGMVLASSFAAGYATWMLKEFAKGNTPPQPTADNWQSFGFKLLENSGVAGYYGSIMMEAMARGQGPGIGPIGDSVVKVAQGAGNILSGNVKAGTGHLIDEALNNTPGLNLFYLRPVIDTLFLNSLNEIMHPQKAVNQQQTRDKYKQTRLWQ